MLGGGVLFIMRGQFTLGAWDGRALLGVVSCERDMRLKVRHIGHLIGMMVADHAAGRGIGRLLLQACIDEARSAAGLELLTLSVTAGNNRDPGSARASMETDCRVVRSNV